MSDGRRVLIAGAGWRVSAFVVPALRALGIRADCIHILRRQNAALEGRLASIGIRTWDTLDGEYDLVINCVTRDSLLSVQRRLIERVPRATHFCDTPIINHPRDLRQARTLARHPRLFSLEDWPFMPNLTPFFARCAREGPPWEFRVENIGVPAHFLAAARAAFGTRGRQMLHAMRRNGALTVRAISGGGVAVHAGGKDYARSKIALWNGADLIEDFFDIRRAGTGGMPWSPEVIDRVLDGDALHYGLGGNVYRTVSIPPSISEMVLGEPGRRGVHELDKCVALMDLFRGTAPARSYGYLTAAWDAVSAWSIDRSRMTVTRSVPWTPA